MSYSTMNPNLDLSTLVDAVHGKYVCQCLTELQINPCWGRCTKKNISHLVNPDFTDQDTSLSE